jgi:hypothetical protein
MSILPADDRIAIHDNADRRDSHASLKGRLLGMAFATLAGAVMTGWLYLIGKGLWACIEWLLFN